MSILIVCAIVGIIVSIIYAIRIKEYQSGTYYQITKVPYFSMRSNLGRYGEYLIYQDLKYLESYGARFLFNVYIPKPDGTTTEIDVMMISPKGIFVFESKNYSGWIFGSENQRYWYQTLPTGRGRSHKEQFYNPIMQNRSHIKHLKGIIGDQIPIWSIIAFSDRCTLKRVNISGNDVCVINRYNTSYVVSSIWNQAQLMPLNEIGIAQLFNLLYPFSQVDEATKAQHIANIYNNLNQNHYHQATSNTTHTQTPPTTIQEKPAIPVCPWCHGDLILRTAKRGNNIGKQFYGCSNYPKCKYMQNFPQN